MAEFMTKVLSLKYPVHKLVHLDIEAHGQHDILLLWLLKIIAVFQEEPKKKKSTVWMIIHSL